MAVMARSRMAHRTPAPGRTGSATRRMMRDRNATATPSPGAAVRPGYPDAPAAPPARAPGRCVSQPAVSPVPDPAEPGVTPPGRPLRAWQRSALARYLAARPRDFLAVATPGAGKTAFALRVAAELLADRTITAVTVVTPTEHLKHQWAAAAASVGIALDPDVPQLDRRDVVGLHRHRDHLRRRRRAPGAAPQPHRDPADAGDPRRGAPRGRRALVGRRASARRSSRATRRLTLTGTPFRSDDNPIPFVDYVPGRRRACCAAAPTTPTATPRRWPTAWCGPWSSSPTPGTSSWRTSAGEEITARLGEPLTAEQTARAWRTALDPGGEWIPAVLAAADRRLTGHRNGGMDDAGGLVIATDQTTARAYAEILRDVTGTPPVVVLSDEAGASDRIAAFSKSDDRWMVAVRMVSEGVDVPRLAVGVYATSASTPLFFAQAVGPLRAVAAAGGDGVGVPAERPGAAGAGERAGGPARPRAGQAAPGRRGVERRGAGGGEPAAGRAGGGREVVHRPARRRRAGPADLRRHLVQRGRGGLHRAARPAGARPGAQRCSARGRRSGCRARRPRPRPRSRRPRPCRRSARSSRSASS